MVAKDIVTLASLRDGETVINMIFFIKEGATTVESEQRIRKSVLDYLATDEGAKEVLLTCNDFNWGDAMNSVPDEFFSQNGLETLNGQRILLSGRQHAIEVYHDEVLLDSKYPTVFKDYTKGYAIVKLFTALEDGVPTDIFAQKWDALGEYEESELVVGYGVLDKNTGLLTDDSDDFYEALEGAEDYLASHGAEPVINVFETSGEKLFDVVFPEDHEEEEQPNGVHSIEEYPGVTSCHIKSGGVDGWWETLIATFEKDGQVYEIQEKSHVSDNIGDSELLYDTMKAIR